MTSTGTSDERISGLSARLGGLRTKAAAGRLDRWLLIGGAVLMPVGVALILLGWAGAAHTTLAYQQNDYIISGGFLGLALVIAGGFLYFAYWQTMRIREARAQSAALARAVGRVERLLAGGAAGEVTGIEAAAETFVVTTNGSLFHRRDCAVVAGRDDVTEVDVATTDLGPCRICTPLGSA